VNEPSDPSLDENTAGDTIGATRQSFSAGLVDAFEPASIVADRTT
jgi:hypothetical protein